MKNIRPDLNIPFVKPIIKKEIFHPNFKPQMFV